VSNQREAPIEIVPYNASWPAMFEVERSILETLLGTWLAGPIEHIGSTAVPQTPAKPVIDVMAPVESLEASLPAIEAAGNAGYIYFPYKPDVMHWFCKPSPYHRTHHLHLVPFRSPLWRERLYFRDVLRENPTLAAEYAALKWSLADQFKWDREAYTDGKGPFIQRVLAGAQE
jgi:GrpB-like predicted nucleotidyltransferase (UPF0157 family)